MISDVCESFSAASGNVVSASSGLAGSSDSCGVSVIFPWTRYSSGDGMTISCVSGWGTGSSRPSRSGRGMVSSVLFRSGRGLFAGDCVSTGCGPADREKVSFCGGSGLSCSGFETSSGSSTASGSAARSLMFSRYWSAARWAFSKISVSAREASAMEPQRSIVSSRWFSFSFASASSSRR